MRKIIYIIIILFSIEEIYSKDVNNILNDNNSLINQGNSIQISTKCLDMNDLMSNINLLNDAKIINNPDFTKTLFLHTNEEKSSGVAWVKSKFYFKDGFETIFKFRISYPKNFGGKEDGGYPGADGFAIVLQSQGINAIGPDAGEFCYAGINNGIAIEYDMYKNTNERGYEFRDPSTCHIAIMYAKNKPLSALHHPGNYITSKDADINSNGTIYYSKILFNKQNSTFEVYIDTSVNFKTPLIRINNFNIDDYMDFSNGTYIGFTGASGLATQNCEILDWEICEYNEDSIVCDTSYFEYKDFENISGLKLLRNAQPSEGKILLCQSDFYKNGIMWRDRPLPVNGEWETEWSFSLNNPTQAKNPDNSFPGADGYSLIIQNTENGLNAIGENGLGLSYENLQNAIAIELDLFKNNKYQLEDRNDPSGNHIALILPSKNGKLSADHIYTDANHITSDIPEIKSNNTIYYAKVNYNATKKKLRIWLSDSPKYVDEVLEINDFDLSKYISLQNSQHAYIGIGASTGDGCQNHYIHSWKFCSNNQQSNPIINTSVENDEFGNNFYDLSLVNNSLYIKRKNIYNYDDNNYNLIIYDNQGKESLRNDIKFTSGNTQIDINSLPLGIYFVRLVSNGEVRDIGKFIKK